MSSVYALDGRKQCPTWKFWTFFFSHGPRPLDWAAHALNMGTKRRTGTSATYFASWVCDTHLKILQTMLKTRPKVLKKCARATIFAQPHSLGGSAGRKPATFFQNVLNYLHCSRMSRKALKQDNVLWRKYVSMVIKGLNFLIKFSFYNFTGQICFLKLLF